MNRTEAGHDATQDGETPSAPASAPAPRAARRSRGGANTLCHVDRPSVPLLLTVPEAAETLRTTPEGLRARLRRAQRLGSDGNITAPLGPGIVGIKVGANTWRVRFDAK